jgi:hypothetical protein
MDDSEKKQDLQHIPAPGGVEAGFCMTDLEELLRGPNGAAYQLECLARLDRKSSDLTKRMKAGFGQDHYEIAETAQNALAAAGDILRRFPVRKNHIS